MSYFDLLSGRGRTKFFKNDMASKAGINELIKRGAISEEKAVPLNKDEINKYSFNQDLKMNGKWINVTTDGRFWTPYDKLKATQKKVNMIIYIVTAIIFTLVGLIFIF